MRAWELLFAPLHRHLHLRCLQTHQLADHRLLLGYGNLPLPPTHRHHHRRHILDMNLYQGVLQENMSRERAHSCTTPIEKRLASLTHRLIDFHLDIVHATVLNENNLLAALKVSYDPTTFTDPYVMSIINQTPYR